MGTSKVSNLLVNHDIIECNSISTKLGAVWILKFSTSWPSALIVKLHYSHVNKNFYHQAVYRALEQGFRTAQDFRTAQFHGSV